MVIDRLHLCKCKKLRYSSEKKRPLPFDRVHKDSKWQKLFSRGHYHDYWFIYLCGSFVETISLFTGRRKRRVGGRFMGQLVHQTPPKYWHSNSVVVVVLWRQKSSTPGETLTFQPGRFIASDPLWSLPVAQRLPWIVCLFDPLRL